MQVIAFSVVSLVALWLGRRSGMPRVNGIAALCAFWIPALILCSLPGVISPSLTDSTWGMIWAGFGSSVFGILAGWLFRPQVKVQGQHQPTFVPRLGRLMRWHLLLTAMLLGFGLLQVYLLLPFVSELGGWSAVFSSAGGELKNNFAASRIAVAQSGGAGGSLGISIAGYVLFMGHASLFTGALLWRNGRQFVALLPLAIAAGYSVVSLQRTSFAMACLLFAFAVSSYAQASNGSETMGLPSGRGRRRLNPLGLLLVIGAAIAAIFIPLTARNTTSTNSVGFTSLLQYFIGGVAGLNARNIGNPHWAAPAGDAPGTYGPLPGYGAYTFNSLFTLIDRFGGALPRAPHDLDYYVVRMFGSYVPTNVGTSFTTFRLDFGWPGVIAMSLTLGLAAGVVSRRVSAGSLDLVPISAFLFTTLCWSFFVNALPGDFRYALLVVIAPALIRRALGHDHALRVPALASPQSQLTVGGKAH